jgi:hypothetical protein
LVVGRKLLGFRLAGGPLGALVRPLGLAGFAPDGLEAEETGDQPAGRRQPPEKGRATTGPLVVGRGLVRAIVGGFFEWPRDSTGEDLAATMDIGRSTFHQHLRAAQRKAFEELYG